MVDPRLFKYWVFKGRENNDTKIYAPKESEAGTSDQVKKEAGFEIKENGEFIKYMTSPSGAIAREAGRYEVKGNTLYTYFDNHYHDSMFSIMALNDNVLKIR